MKNVRKKEIDMKNETNWPNVDRHNDSHAHLLKFITKAIAEDDPDKRAAILPSIMHWLDDIANDAMMCNVERDAKLHWDDDQIA